MSAILRRGSVGPEVARVQTLLNARGASPALATDGVFGAKTEAAVRHFQAAHAPPVDGEVGPITRAALGRPAGTLPPPVSPPPPPPVPGASSLRQQIVNTAYLGHRHAPEIHYSQGSRRMEFVRLNLRPPQFPTYTDCSAFATWCYWAAGAADPNGAGYNGTGYTGTLRDHGRRVTTPEPGDLVFYSSPGHVVVSVGGDVAISHGSENGPLVVRYTYRTVAEIRSYL